MAEQIFGKFCTLVHKQSVKKSHFSDVCLLQSSRHYTRSQMWCAREKFPSLNRKRLSSLTKSRNIKWKIINPFKNRSGSELCTIIAKNKQTNKQTNKQELSKVLCVCFFPIDSMRCQQEQIWALLSRKLDLKKDILKKKKKKKKHPIKQPWKCIKK